MIPMPPAFDTAEASSARAIHPIGDVVKKPGGKVWGLLHQVSDCLIESKTAKARRRKFDEIEGEDTNYRRETIKVRRPDVKIVPALTNAVKCPKPGLKTNVDYVRHIVCGLREHLVAHEYIARVKAIAAANNPDIAAEVEKL